MCVATIRNRKQGRKPACAAGWNDVGASRTGERLEVRRLETNAPPTKRRFERFNRIACSRG